jgi:hypothetical protein
MHDVNCTMSSPAKELCIVRCSLEQTEITTTLHTTNKRTLQTKHGNEGLCTCRFSFIVAEKLPLLRDTTQTDEATTSKPSNGYTTELNAPNDRKSGSLCWSAVSSFRSKRLKNCRCFATQHKSTKQLHTILQRNILNKLTLTCPKAQVKLGPISVQCLPRTRPLHKLAFTKQLVPTKTYFLNISGHQNGLNCTFCSHLCHRRDSPAVCRYYVFKLVRHTR